MTDSYSPFRFEGGGDDFDLADGTAVLPVSAQLL
jgi:hypothetical protein